MKPAAATRALRPLGFFLYGLLWLVLTLAIVVLAWLTAVVPLFDFQINQGAWANPWSLIFWIPAFTLVMVIGPWCMFSQSMLGFVFAGQSLSKAHQNRPLTRLVGSNRGRYFAAIIDTPATRLWTEVGNIGFSPGWRFATASLALVSGVCLARFVDSPVAAVAGWALLVAGASVSLWSILPRLKDPAPLAFPTHSTDPEAKAKCL